MQNHKITSQQFKEFFQKFDVMFMKLKQRDKSLASFKHYFDKIRSLREEHHHIIKNMTGAAAPDPAKMAKDE